MIPGPHTLGRPPHRAGVLARLTPRADEGRVQLEPLAHPCPPEQRLAARGRHQRQRDALHHRLVVAGVCSRVTRQLGHPFRGFNVVHINTREQAS